MKLQPSRRKFSVHHTTMHHVTSCKATCDHNYILHQKWKASNQHFWRKCCQKCWFQISIFEEKKSSKQNHKHNDVGRFTEEEEEEEEETSCKWRDLTQCVQLGLVDSACRRPALISRFGNAAATLSLLSSVVPPRDFINMIIIRALSYCGFICSRPSQLDFFHWEIDSFLGVLLLNLQSNESCGLEDLDR